MCVSSRERVSARSPVGVDACGSEGLGWGIWGRMGGGSRVLLGDGEGTPQAPRGLAMHAAEEDFGVGSMCRRLEEEKGVGMCVLVGSSASAPGAGTAPARGPPWDDELCMHTHPPGIVTPPRPLSEPLNPKR